MDPAQHADLGPIPPSDLDLVLISQLAVAWAGEAGEDPRLGWWRTDLVSEFGGEDLFRRLLPATWPWAVLRGAREAARRKDAELRSRDHDPDRLITLFSLGFEVDERVDERLTDLEQLGRPPADALPALKDVITDSFHRDHFRDWVLGHGRGRVTTSPSPVGRRVDGAIPSALTERVTRLVAALDPLTDSYPLPHFLRSA
jgi:hypothetical protein